MTIYINVSNTFNTRAKSGIQRVIREVVARFEQRNNIVFIVWFESGFYQLSSQEISELLAANLFKPENTIKLDELQTGDIFFDIDASWIDVYDIKQLYQLLKKQGVILVKMHYDAVPVLFPQFSHPNTVFSYVDNLSSSLQYCDYWLCISRTVRNDLLKIADSIGVGQPVTKLIPLGADYKQSGIRHNKIDKFKFGKYILVVSTIEPRKNHQLILDVFDELQREGQPTNLVIVGKRGWHIGEIAARIENNPDFNKKIFWLQNATDEEISLLYKNAFVTANLSHYEGLGLPVIESLSHGCVTLCTSGTAMEEVASGAAFCVNPDMESVVNALQQLELPEVYAKYKQQAQHYVVPTWDQSASEIAHFLQSIQQAEDILYAPRQAVYISIRADALYKSLNSVIKNMKFISKVVILTSDQKFPEMRKKLEGLAIDINLVKESELDIVTLPDDAQMRATYLRRKLYENERVEPNFIAFDDDSLVIDTVNISDFLEQGRHKAHYYENDGRGWLGAYPRPTSFDLGIWRTVKFLQNGGYDTRLYNSHMPQIINKKIGSMIFDRTSGLGLDEWSSYYNIAKYLYPHCFQEKIYRTIAWPPDLETWLPSSKPEKIVFQNYYASDADLVSKPPTKVAEKIKQWLAEYTEKKAIQDSMEPSLPEILISRKGLRFNSSSISCHKNSKIFIKLIVDADNFQINCSFDMHKIGFNNESLPRHFFIPAQVFNPAAENTINLFLNLTETQENFELAIPVTILK